MIELLDKQIDDLDALLDGVLEDWQTPVVQGDLIWFAKLINKTRLLRDEYQNQRKNLVGQASQE
jgi:hypothetical protein